MKKVSDICEYLENLYPSDLASNFDFGKIGLQFGSKKKIVRKVMIALDATMDVIEEALNNDIDLLIIHHPFMFNSLLSLDYDSPFGKRFLKVIKNELNIFAMHTNFDVAENGMNDILAKILGLQNIRPANDCINSNSVLRIGEISSLTLQEVIKLVAIKFNESQLKYVGTLNQKINQVGIVGGSGATELLTAFNSGCDLLITGEIKHNIALEAKELPIALIEISHNVEGYYKMDVAQRLQKAFPDIEIITAKTDINPFTSLTV